jgi:Flp pilus assembly pilin Flp
MAFGSGSVFGECFQGKSIAVARGPRRTPMAKLLQNFWHDDQGQDVAEYAVMLAVILVIVVGTIRLIGSNANNVFSSVGSAIQ